MTWQHIVIIQVIVSAVMTIFTRKLALADRKLFFIIGCLSYASVAFVGLLYTLVLGDSMPHIPDSRAWLYLIAEGAFIPAAWLLQYKIIGMLGASNAVLVTMLNYVGAALMGVLLLHDTISWKFLLGALLILSSIYIAFHVQPDQAHSQSAAPLRKCMLVVCMVLFFSIGMFSEKQAIDIIGVWNYSTFGWTLQFIGAFTVLALFGRAEWVHLSRTSVRRGLLLGLLTSLSGGLYIYALSLGTLSHTIIAISGKVALTMVLAAIFLHERNALRLRFLSLVLSMSGLVLLII